MAEPGLPIAGPPLVFSMAQSMARAEALLPHPAAERSSGPEQASRGPITRPIPVPGGRPGLMAAGLPPVAFFFSDNG